LSEDRSESERISRAYLRFAEVEARGRSPLYETLARGVAADPEIIAFLAALPKEKRQPNLLLAAVRHCCGTPGSWDEFRCAAIDNADAVREIMLARSTQTNEPARCATLLPVLARLPQPLALIEVGASAGLCLLPDFYGYDYGGQLLYPHGAARQHPVFPCAVDAKTPIPAAMPQIAWRAGLDLNPLDVSDPEQAAWLRTLVWPEQTDRLARLCAAMKSQRRASLASTLVICGMIWRPWQRRRQNPRRSSSFIPPYLPMLQRPLSAPNSPDRSGRDAIFGWRTRRRTSFPKLPHASAKQGCGAGSSCR